MKRIVATLLVSFLATACGSSSTRVVLVNNTTNNFTKVTVRAQADATKNIAYNDLKKSTTSSEQDWDHKEALAVSLVTESPQTTDSTGSVTLTEGKKNTITLRDGVSSSFIVYTVVAE